ncbi:DUF2156 domain-containing protein [Pseudonocardia sp. K10HN5]|uniref:DUF2156 domain-containing protein n=2 Tax=Pseudonocardia acidicola TaxID=2724939 RepID=A0ABX1SKE7_9PSEU|nr:DUF2156 domain-containing protein [Pseudonocardia acidicola]
MLRRAPLTVGSVPLLWVIGAVTGSLWRGPSRELRAAIGAGPGPLRDGHWWSLFTSATWCPGLASYVVNSIAIVALLPVAERRLGSLRTAGLLGVVQVVGTLAGLGLVALITIGGGRWADHLQVAVAVGPGAALVGTLLAASAGLAALWRRRLRLVLLAVLAMLALYSGLLGDVLRLAAGVFGLVLGMLTLGRLRPGGRRDQVIGTPSRPEARVLVALLVAASALGPLIAAWAQTRVGPLSVLRFVFASPPPDALTVEQICAGAGTDRGALRECAELQARLRLSGLGPGLMSAMPVVLLLIAAEGLRRGRRAAWLAAFGLNLGLAALGLALAAHTASVPMEQRIILGAVVHLHAWLLLALPALQPLLVAVVLVAARGRFDVRAPVGTYRAWARVAAGALAGVSVLFVGGSLLVAHGYDRPPGLLMLLGDLPVRFLPPVYLGEVEPTFLPVSGVATILYEWTGLVFWIVVGAGALVSFTRSRLRDPEPDQRRVRELLEDTSGSSLSFMTTWPGHTYWFTPDGAAVVAYRVIGGVAVTTGDPVGKPAARERAVRGFVEHCHAHGWTPCLYSVGAEVEAIARGLGWSTVQVAEETVLPLPGLAFTGKKWQDVRTALNKAEKAGMVAEWCSYRTAPLAVTDQIRALSEEWVADKGLPEMGFTLGGLEELDDDEVRLLIAVDADRTVHGVTSWLPVRCDGEIVGWTLDFMRRRSDGFKGVMEFLIASAALRCKDEGVEFLSLSGAPLARLDRGEPIGGLQKLLDAAGRRLEPVYGFRSLLAFKAKFQPVYRPLYMAYPDPTALPAIGNAIGRAYLPRLSARQATRLARAVLR